MRLLLSSLVLGGAFASMGGSAAAQTATFSYTGGEQSFVVPVGDHAVAVVATGAAGGTKLGSPGGRGAVVSGALSVTPGEVLYVEVGGMGGDPFGGFNGGGNPAVGAGATWVGGGGASDVRTLPRSDGVPSLNSRLIVAGGGGAAWNGGDAGQSGGGSAFAGGGAGAQTSGGAGGCPPDGVLAGCGGAGTLGQGGEGGYSGFGIDQRWGGGGGGGLYGGGGGGADLSGVGGGGGGSSLVPANGSLSLAPVGTPPSVVITAYHQVTSLPVKGHTTGVTSFDPSTGLFTFTASGAASPIGAFTTNGNGSVGGADVGYTVMGTQTVVAANGDQLFGSTNGSGVFGDNGTSSTGSYVFTITGGTGRFANASGSWTVTFDEPSITFGTIWTAATTTTEQGNINLGRPPAAALDRPTRTAHHRHHTHRFHNGSRGHRA
jgi:adhesin/invasin